MCYVPVRSLKLFIKNDRTSFKSDSGMDGDGNVSMQFTSSSGKLCVEKPNSKNFKISTDQHIIGSFQQQI